MSKVKAIAFIVGAVIFSYIMILLVWAAFSAITTNVAVEIAARPGIEQYTGAVEGVNYAPLVIFISPVVIGLVAVVVVLKKKS